MDTSPRAGALKRAGLDAKLVEACYMGNVCSANLGQAPARQSALFAGLPESCTCTTVNKVCSSGLKSVSLAAADIALRHSEIIVAGGMENMSLVPHYVSSARFGHKLGHMEMKDGLLYDGLQDPHEGVHMGMCAEACAKRYGFSRDEQDAYAKESYRRAKVAWEQGKFVSEIEKVVVGEGKRKTVVERDEEVWRTDMSRVAGMKPAFLSDGSGSVTSGNASGLNDGAAAVVLMSRSKATAMGIRILATIRGYADAECAPVEFTTAPSKAIPKAVSRAGVGMEDVDVFEVNEAFAVVALANRRLLGTRASEDRVNLWGGAVSLGHPLGCSGARILVTLLSVLRDGGGKIGVAGICNGGGGSTAMVVERHVESSSL